MNEVLKDKEIFRDGIHLGNRKDGEYFCSRCSYDTIFRRSLREHYMKEHLGKKE